MLWASSRYLSFGYSEDMNASFWNFSSEGDDPKGSIIAGRWDAVETGPVHIFCYDVNGAFTAHTSLPAPEWDAESATYETQLNNMDCRSKGLVKIVVEDDDFEYSARSGTVFYNIQ